MALMSATPASVPSRTLTATASSSAVLSAWGYEISAGSSCFRITSAASRRRPALRSHAAGCCPAFETFLANSFGAWGHTQRIKVNEMQLTSCTVQSGELKSIDLVAAASEFMVTDDQGQ